MENMMLGERSQTEKAKTDKIEPSHEKFAQDETTLIEGDKTSFPDAVSRKQSQTFVNIQTLSLNYHAQRRVASISTPIKSSKDAYWSIPETATGSIFLRSFHPASKRVLGKETNQMEKSGKPKEEPSKIKRISVDDMLKDILILSSEFSKPLNASSPITSPKLKEVLPEYCRTYTFKHPLIDLSATMPRRLTGTMPVHAQKHLQPPDHLQQTKAVININSFLDTVLIPAPVLPRKPHRQSEIETHAIENENLENVPKQTMPTPPEGTIKPRKRAESEAKVIRGEGFKTVAATQYESIAAMTNLAIVNCQIYGRNALNLKGFFIPNCPDLTPLAYQLIYLNLSFNDISSFPTEVYCLKHLQVLILRNNPIRIIPSDIQQLKLLRVFNIAFNLITTLPLGLFYLSYLEELDISYNSIASIPNEIQKLRSLKKLVVDGNELTSFPSGILRLHLEKIRFENTFTIPSLWKENSLNSPQRLTQLTALFFLKNNLHKYYDEIPDEIQMLLNCTSRCEWCDGPKFDEGYRVIQSCNVFGATHLPVMFHVCSSSCYREVLENSFF
ncbi:leucine-rich repeat-containing protein 63 [Myotis yumanensis]|uniref:leucine-rich repeat-containing protein 63 n=1 Tax=Myotis yumanensis TaxID=159337 RepID=UPI0038D1537C